MVSGDADSHGVLVVGGGVLDGSQFGWCGLWIGGVAVGSWLGWYRWWGDWCLSVGLVGVGGGVIGVWVLV